MEDASKSQSSVSGNKLGGSGSAKLLRYPLRSSTKSKDDKPPLSAASTPSSSRRGKSSSVAQSVSVLDLSAKDKSAKPPRRYSIPTKSSASPAATKPANNVTPTSEARTTRSRNMDGKSNTPVSDASRSLTRRKFSVLSSASYWLSQIKLSEAAGKHQVSLGFFKLAQVAACENLQLLRDELKSYALRHNILDLGESAKEVFESYDLSENMEKVQVSETCSHELEQESQVSEDALSLSSVNGTQKPKPRSSSNNVGIAVKENNQKKLVPNSKATKASTNKKMTNQQSGKMQKNSQKQITNKPKEIVKSKGKKSAPEGVLSSAEEVITQENKENMDAPPAEEISMES